MNPVNYVFVYIFLNILGFDRAATQSSWECKESVECISLRKCPELLDRLRTKAQSAFDLLFDLHCGFEGRVPLVCCPPSFRPAQIQTERSTTPPQSNGGPVISTVDVSFHPRLQLLDTESCGILGEDDKIINGEKAGLFEFPWMALLGYINISVPASGIKYRCGGSLINKRYVLTAAHCLDKRRYRLVTVRLGEYDLSQEKDCKNTCAPPVQNIDVEEVIPHPEYSRSSSKSDIGLIRLSADAVFHEGTMPVCLPIGLDEQTKELTGSKVTVTGWGRTENRWMSSVLLKVDIPVIPRYQCAEKYKNLKDIDVTQICAGGNDGKDSCTGDSGGPMQAITLRNSNIVYVQYGLVSYGPKMCGHGDIPGVYTKIGFYMKWILDTIRP